MRTSRALGTTSNPTSPVDSLTLASNGPANRLRNMMTGVPVVVSICGLTLLLWRWLSERGQEEGFNPLKCAGQVHYKRETSPNMYGLGTCKGTCVPYIWFGGVFSSVIHWEEWEQWESGKAAMATAHGRKLACDLILTHFGDIVHVGFQFFLFSIFHKFSIGMCHECVYVFVYNW